MMSFHCCTATALAALGLLTGWQPAQAQNAPVQASPPAELQIVVLSGENGVNIVKKKTAVKPVVEVRDRNGAPVAGASVVFLLPANGATATFANGSKMFTALTDGAGRAAVNSMQPLGQGALKISVTASYQGQAATATISQVNYLTAAQASAAAGAGSGAGGGGGAAAGGAGAGAAGGVSAGVIAGIVGGVAAAAAVAAKVATGGKGGSSNSGGGSTNTTPSGTIGGPGSPTFGPPH